MAGILLLLACSLPNLRASIPPTEIPQLSTLVDLPTQTLPAATAPAPTSTFMPLPSPTPFHIPDEAQTGDLLPYVIQAGDTLSALAARFRITTAQLLADNPTLPEESQWLTLSPGEILDQAGRRAHLG